jgi:hypothetical protein
MSIISYQKYKVKIRKVGIDMRLEELLQVLSENKNVVVCINGKEVSRYDGRDSINTEFNEKVVCSVDCKDNTFYVEIK